MAVHYPRIIAHRCGGALAPENTLPGLHIAQRMGCHGVEFDAMLTADGAPVLIHDETLERTTSGSGDVATMSAEQFARLDAGIRHHKAFARTPPPTLEQALRDCAALGLWANVEIKPAAGFEAETGSVVAAMCREAKCEIVLSSFSADALRAAMTVAPHVPRALLVETLPEDWRQQAAALGAVALHMAAKQLEGNASGFRRVCEFGLPIACYTVNDRALADKLFAAGVQAIFSDRIDLWTAEEM